jgi:hypothetical protein
VRTAAAQASVQTDTDSLTATLSEIEGGVLARESEDASFAEATVGFVLQVLGQVQTESDGKVRLDFATGTLVRVGPGTLFTLQPAEENPQGLVIRLQLAVGKLWIILQGGSLEVENESGVASVRGSLLSVESKPGSEKIRITCLEGHCALSNPAGEVEIGAGQSAQANSAAEPPKVGQMSDADYQDWLDNVPEAAPFVPAPQGPAKDDETSAGNAPLEVTPTETPPPSETPTETPPPSETPTEPPPTEAGCATNCGQGGGNGGPGNGTGNEGKGKGNGGASNGSQNVGKTEDPPADSPQEETSNSNNGKGKPKDADLPANASKGSKRQDGGAPGDGDD